MTVLTNLKYVHLKTDHFLFADLIRQGVESKNWQSSKLFQ